ncbi:1231_t:CDS:2 [Cetraspora pellucida]|uniref:1231_t:CDS:1 n=1 Tax=Cetraspora pellucida TaxID=1433469 RepID=A0A9N8W307_9GLOM|nr:1231_t:CDS:2 [Cetraspora pellucida]
MVSTKDPKYPKGIVLKEYNSAWMDIKSKPKNEIENTIKHLIKSAAPTILDINPLQNFNAAIPIQNQIIEEIIKKVAETITKINDEIAECQKVYNSITDSKAQYKLMNRIKDFKKALNTKDKKEKKDQDLKEHQQVVKYDSPGCFPFLHKYLDLLEHIHESIEFRAADSKRRIEGRTLRYTLLFCLCKGGKTICFSFPALSVIVSQDDKAKVLLSISAVGKTFQVMQSFNEPVIILNHNFPVGSQQKLVLFVYLIIDLSDTNDKLRSGQLSIYICPQYEPTLLITSGQSAYNPVERAMVSLSAKLAGITQSVDKHSSHLDSQGKVINLELARKNFKHTGDTLCELWRWDNIFRRPVMT